jgi:hypothetical protein
VPDRRKSCENIPGAEEISDEQTIRQNPPSNRPVSDTTAALTCQPDCSIESV